MNMYQLPLSLLLLQACGGESDGGSCELEGRGGTYLSQYHERDGNCGPLPDTISVIDGMSGEVFSATDASCDFEFSNVSTDNCKIDAAWNCVLEDGVSASYVASGSWNRSGTRFSAEIQIAVRQGGQLVCSSLYDGTLTKR